MTWAKFDDRYYQHPKIWGLSDGSFRLHTSGIIHCMQNNTRGFVRNDMVRTLVPKFRFLYLNNLVEVGLWTETEGGYTIHDFNDWQKTKTRDELKSLRDARSAAGKRGSDARWRT